MHPEYFRCDPVHPIDLGRGHSGCRLRFSAGAGLLLRGEFVVAKKRCVVMEKDKAVRTSGKTKGGHRHQRAMVLLIDHKPIVVSFLGHLISSPTFSIPQTMLTAISMSAIATNGVVPGGGSYFMISR